MSELVDEVMIIISTLEPTYFDTFDHYILEYNDIGTCDEYIANYIEVVTVPNTKNIITMYPILSNNIFAKNVRKRDEEKFELHDTKVKRKSQIEKFYEKYGKEG